MSGFNAAEAVDDLTYDFTKYVEGAKGTIPEPSSDQIEVYRTTIFECIKNLGVDPETLQGGAVSVAKLDFDVLFGIMDKAGDIERSMLHAAADLCQIDQSLVDQLPFRVKRAFSGWIMGIFNSPED